MPPLPARPKKGRFGRRGGAESRQCLPVGANGLLPLTSVVEKGGFPASPCLRVPASFIMGNKPDMISG